MPGVAKDPIDEPKNALDSIHHTKQRDSKIHMSRLHILTVSFVEVLEQFGENLWLQISPASPVPTSDFNGKGEYSIYRIISYVSDTVHAWFQKGRHKKFLQDKGYG